MYSKRRNGEAVALRASRVFYSAAIRSHAGTSRMNSIGINGSLLSIPSAYGKGLAGKRSPDLSFSGLPGGGIPLPSVPGE
jgi:hypothetical protein